MWGRFVAGLHEHLVLTRVLLLRALQTLLCFAIPRLIGGVTDTSCARTCQCAHWGQVRWGFAQAIERASTKTKHEWRTGRFKKSLSWSQSLANWEIDWICHSQTVGLRSLRRQGGPLCSAMQIITMSVYISLSCCSPLCPSPRLIWKNT